MENKLTILTKGILKENPVLILLLGTCPTLAVTTGGINGLGMGVSTMVVLICSNTVISMIKNFIPSKVRIPAYIVVIAAFVSVVQLLLKAYLPFLDKALGLYIPLIVVNCIILGRAEMFASKNSVSNSILDGVGMGLGFTLALVIMGCIRELLGAGAIFGVKIFADTLEPMGIFLLAPGGFFVYALLIAFMNWKTAGQLARAKSAGCGNCAMSDGCGQSKES